MTKVYSRDEERFQDDLCEVLADLDGDGYLEPGATIYEADKVEYVASKFFRGGVDNIIETIRDQAWEEADEFAESFAENITKEKLAELETLISNWLDANVPVNFFTVRNVKPVEVTEAMIADYRNAPAPGVTETLQAKALRDPPEVVAAEFDRMVERAAARGVAPSDQTQQEGGR